MTEKTNNAERRIVLIQGTVVSDKADKTIKVSVERKVKHPLYGKYVRRTTTVAAHDEDNSAAMGDIVEVVFGRPRSKRKRWLLKRIVSRGEAGKAASESAEDAGLEEVT